MTEKKKYDPWEIPGCHDCPAGAEVPAGVGGDAGAPADELVECHGFPKFPVNIGGRGDAARVVFIRSQMQGDEYCYRHPAYIEAMDPERYGDEDDGDDEDDEPDDDEEE